MKEETKELIDWIKENIKFAGSCKYMSIDNNCWLDNCEKAIKFLNSLPQIESRLCRGGYIQDENGTPCCEGDLIEYKDLLSNEIVKGTLYWSVNDKCFYAKINDKPRSISTYFKKVKE